MTADPSASLERVEIVDVGPRDGLQNESVQFSTDTKIGFITRLLDAGIRRIEVASFVNPKRVPQMADAEAVLEALPRDLAASFIGLVLNARGVERALATSVDELNFVVVASNTFSQRNQGATTEESLATWLEISALAREAGIPCGVTLSAAFGCPYEGEVPLERIVELAKRLREGEPSEITIADTIGVAVPPDVKRRFEAVSEVTGDTPLRCHFHNTRNTGIANAYAAYEAGVRILDASCGGIGGCPFAPAATGNIATEDLLYLLDRAGIETGVSAAKIIDTAHWLESHLERPVPSLVSRAGLFPAAAS